MSFIEQIGFNCCWVGCHLLNIGCLVVEQHNNYADIHSLLLCAGRHIYLGCKVAVLMSGVEVTVVLYFWNRPVWKPLWL